MILLMKIELMLSFKVSQEICLSRTSRSMFSWTKFEGGLVQYCSKRSSVYSLHVNFTLVVLIKTSDFGYVTFLFCRDVVLEK